jgi:hypothetical protein
LFEDHGKDHAPVNNPVSSSRLLGINLPSLELITATPATTPSDVQSDGHWPRPKFPKDTVGFHTELKKRVANYFTENKLEERDPWQMYLKSAIIMVWLVASYVGLVFFSEHWYQASPAAISLALAMATVGMSIQHDGGHHGYSRRNWINRIAAGTMDMIGASSYLWHRKHAVFHHTYVNIEGQDTDIDAGPMGRFSPHQPRYKIHRWQHLYLWFLYGAMAIRCFEQALALARQQGARALELRAATSLARLCLRDGQPSRLRRVLGPIHDAFDEGADTGDLIAARALLAGSRR